jgi:hypothetical protein
MKCRIGWYVMCGRCRRKEVQLVLPAKLFRVSSRNLHVKVAVLELFDTPPATLPTPSMAYKAEIKTTFDPSRVIQPIYTGGSVALSDDGRILATCLGEEALLTDLNTGAHLARIEGVSPVHAVQLYIAPRTDIDK